MEKEVLKNAFEEYKSIAIPSTEQQTFEAQRMAYETQIQ